MLKSIDVIAGGGAFDGFRAVGKVAQCSQKLRYFFNYSNQLAEG